jgi:hypothetical protein
MAKHLQNSVDQQPKASAEARQALARRVRALGVEKKAVHATPKTATAAKITATSRSTHRSEVGNPEGIDVGGDASEVSSSPQLQRWPLADAQPSVWRSSMAQLLGGLGGMHFGITARGLISPQFTLSRQLNLVLAPFWDRPVTAPFGNGRLRASKRFRGRGLRSVMGNKFIRTHPSIIRILMALSIRTPIE